MFGMVAIYLVNEAAVWWWMCIALSKYFSTTYGNSFLKQFLIYNTLYRKIKFDFNVFKIFIGFI